MNLETAYLLTKITEMTSDTWESEGGIASGPHGGKDIMIN